YCGSRTYSPSSSNLLLLSWSVGIATTNSVPFPQDLFIYSSHEYTHIPTCHQLEQKWIELYKVSRTTRADSDGIPAELLKAAGATFNDVFHRPSKLIKLRNTSSCVKSAGGISNSFK
uniref:Uncharacterized protein n=1 Tax=Megaselia scalaris TaxID=36166 RepID=T1H4P8_MEGSC